MENSVKFFQNQPVLLLSLAFLLLFFGYNGGQQYVTTYFSSLGVVDLGFYSLIIIYLFFTFSDPLAAVFVSKYGAKKSMIISSLFYTLYMLSLLSKSTLLIYLGSALLGIAASLLWTGQSVYLIRTSEAHVYGKNAGFFSTLLAVGSGIGILVFGLVLQIIPFKDTFLIFSLFPTLAFFILCLLQSQKTVDEQNKINGQTKTNHFQLLRKSITSLTAWQLSSIWFVMSFVSGLIMGIIPLEIGKIFGLSYVGYFSSLYFILPIFFSYFIGKISDKYGRKIMIFCAYLLFTLGLLSFTQPGYFLILGIIFMALNWTILKPTTTALIGDVSTGKNVEYLTGLFWMVSNIGVVTSLLLSKFLQIKVVYLYFISLGVVILCFFAAWPLWKKGTNHLKEKLAEEIK